MSRTLRAFLTLTIAASTVAGVLALSETRAQGNSCQAQCNQERNRCFVLCERPNAPANCLIACSDVYQICLSGCVPE